MAAASHARAHVLDHPVAGTLGTLEDEGEEGPQDSAHEKSGVGEEDAPAIPVKGLPQPAGRSRGLRGK